MLKFLITLLILLTQINAFTFDKYQLINGYPFHIVQDSYDEYGDTGIMLKFYRGTETEPLLNLVLENKSGSCSSRSTQEGNFKIKDDTIIIYSHWKRKGRAYDSPIGDRIQIFKIDTNGKIKEKSGRVYIEKHTKIKDNSDGMNYLFTPPKTAKEKALFAEYKKSVERIFEASFVVGKEAEELSNEVYWGLQKKEKSTWH